MQSLHKIYFRQKAKQLLKYFYRWKLSSQLNEKIYRRFIKKTIRCRYLLKVARDRQLRKVKSAFFVWNFQTKQGFPFLKDNHQKEKRLQDILAKINAYQEKVKEKPSFFHVHELCLALETINRPLERLFENLKNQTLRKMKCMFQIERMVILSKQSILIRTLSVNLDLFSQRLKRKGSSFRAEIGPKELSSILEHVYKRETFNLEEQPNYIDKFKNKMALVKDRPRDAQILMTGIWANMNPLFRLREYIFVKLVQRTYIKWISVAVLKLRFNKKLAELKDGKKVLIEEKNNKFRKIWARMFLAFCIKSKLEKISGDTLIAFEYFKKKREIVPPVETKIQAFDKKLLKIHEIPDYEETLRDSFKRNLKDAMKTFAKKFLYIILKPGGRPKDIKKELVNHLVDSLHSVTCGTLQSLNNTPRDLN